MINNEDIINIINEWNPAEIYPLLRDEYTLEVKMIVKIINSNKAISKNELGKEIDKIFLYTFNSPLVYQSNILKCTEIASQILKLLDN